MEGKRLNATLTFGMVVIPVGVVPVLDSTDRTSFKRLHKVCEQPVKQPLYCPVCETGVETADVVSGFEYAKGQFLVITDEEKASVAPNRSPMIEIAKFVDDRSTALDEAVRLGSDKSYWLPPQNEHVLHPYTVLAHGMVSAGVIGIAKATVWSRQWPVCIEVIDGMFVLTQLHPASAVRAGGLDTPDVKANEGSMARAVIAEFTGTLEPNDLVSDADNALRDLVQAKLKGEQFTAPEVATPEPTMDIMDALKASMPKKASKPKTKRTKAAV